jgi:hypothetical protein
VAYEELRKLAAQRLAQEKPGQTLHAGMSFCRGGVIRRRIPHWK